MVAVHNSTPSKPRTTLSLILKFILIISSAFMLLKLLCIISGSRSPIAVVSSESMEPAFYRGDVIFVWNREPVFDVGDIAVCWFEGRKLPMVHRIIQKRSLPIEADSSNSKITIERQSTQHEYEYLTKGDNNSDDDTTLYPEGQPYLFRHDIVGVVYGYVPKIGYLTLILNDYPWLKNILIGSIVLAAYFKRNEEQDTAQQQNNKKEVCSIALENSPQTGLSSESCSM